MIIMSGNGPIRAAADTPLAILGASLLFADYWAADRDNESAVNPRITIATGVSNWPEEATRNAALVQAGTTAQPVLSATSFGGKPGVTFDGVNDGLLATLSPTIATGSRVYVWVVGNWTATSLGADFRRMLELSCGNGTTATSYVSLISATDASNLWGSRGLLSDGTDDGAGVAANGQTMTTDRVVAEYGLLATTTGKFVLNGNATDGTFSGTLTTGAHEQLALGFRANTAGLWAPICVNRLIIAHNPSSITALPSAGQLTAMRALLSGYL